MSPYPVSYSLSELSLESCDLAHPRLTGFVIGLYIGLKHGLHKGHARIAPKFLVGLLGLSGLTCCCLQGITVNVIAAAVQVVVGLVGTAVSFATLEKLLTVTLLRDLASQAPKCLALPFLELALCKFHFFLQKMLITATTAVTLPVFAVLIAISSALMLLIGAVLTTLIGWGSVDK